MRGHGALDSRHRRGSLRGARAGLTGASAQNEGKIHLGYVYANDPTLSTARTMVRGGLSFAPLLRRWLGDAVDSVPVSRLALEEMDGATVDYFGGDPSVAPARMGRRDLRNLYHADQAMALDAGQAERRLLWAAAAERVVSGRALPGYLPDSSLTPAGREDLLESFLSYVRDERSVDLPRLLGARRRRIRRWARELSLPR